MKYLLVLGGGLAHTWELTDHLLLRVCGSSSSALVVQLVYITAMINEQSNDHPNNSSCAQGQQASCTDYKDDYVCIVMLFLPVFAGVVEPTDIPSVTAVIELN